MEPGKLDERSAESDTMAESGKNGMCHERLQPPDTENGMSGGVGGGRGAILCPRPDHRLAQESGEDAFSCAAALLSHAALTARRAEILGKVPFESEGLSNRTEPRQNGAVLNSFCTRGR